jgi:Fe-S cluster assembly ATP-binding protein
VKAEKAEFLGKNLLSLLPHERALLGMFLVFQNPREISGISLLDFYVEVVQKHFLYKKNITLRQALSHSEYKEEISRVAIVQKILKWFQDLELDASFLKRDVFSGFSGGEKKKLELITLLLIKPSFIFLDELDSGLDAHSVILCSQILRQYQKETGAGILLITHLEKIMEFLPPQKKYIFKDGTCLLQQ